MKSDRELEIRALLEISNEDLAHWAERIRPVIRWGPGGKRHPRGTPHWVANLGDHRKTSYTWVENSRGEAAGDLELIKTIQTFHTWGAPALFKPSVAEVIAQIPVEMRDSVDAFEVISEGLGPPAVLQEGFHVTNTALYRQS